MRKFYFLLLSIFIFIAEPFVLCLELFIQPACLCSLSYSGGCRQFFPWLVLGCESFLALNADRLVCRSVTACLCDISLALILYYLFYFIRRFLCKLLLELYLSLSLSPTLLNKVLCNFHYWLFTLLFANTYFVAFCNFTIKICLLYMCMCECDFVLIRILAKKNTFHRICACNCGFVLRKLNFCILSTAHLSGYSFNHTYFEYKERHIFIYIYIYV